MPPDQGSTRYAYALALSRSRRRPRRWRRYARRWPKDCAELTADGRGSSSGYRRVALDRLWRVGVGGGVYVVLAHPSTQTITFLVLVVMLIVLQRTVGQRLR